MKKIAFLLTFGLNTLFAVGLQQKMTQKTCFEQLEAILKKEPSSQNTQQADQIIARCINEKVFTRPIDAITCLGTQTKDTTIVRLRTMFDIADLQINDALGLLAKGYAYIYEAQRNNIQYTALQQSYISQIEALLCQNEIDVQKINNVLQQAMQHNIDGKIFVCVAANTKNEIAKARAFKFYEDLILRQMQQQIVELSGVILQSIQK